MDQKADKPQDAPDLFSSQIQSAKLRRELINLARRKDVPADDCEDIASEAISRAIRNQANYDPGRGLFLAWIKAIEGNVINTYWRRQYAQKRKAEGGVISLDAASIQFGSSEDNRREPKDASVEKQHVSEEVQHFIDTASLSEKERKAIASRRGKKTEQTGAKFSPSTARRAVEKLKQAKRDEKFRECPRGPDASECAYGKIPPAERRAALLYDQLRRTSWFVNAVDCWRKSSEWKNVQVYLENETALKRFPLTILRQHWPEQLHLYRQAAHQRDVVLRRRFEAAVDIALAFPEWPTLGYCQFPPKKRRKRLEEFGWTFGVEPFWEIDERTFELFVNAMDETQEPGASLAAFLGSINEAPISKSHVYTSMHLVRIDWRYPPKTIVESFNKWAGKEQKRELEKIGRAGRPRTTHLVGFACIRLIDEFGLSKGEAMSWLKERYGGPIPSTPEALERAVRDTRKELKDYSLPSPAEMGV